MSFYRMMPPQSLHPQGIAPFSTISASWLTFADVSMQNSLPPDSGAPDIPLAPYKPPESPWRSYAPIAAGVGAGAFLVAGELCPAVMLAKVFVLSPCCTGARAGTVIGFKRTLAKSAESAAEEGAKQAVVAQKVALDAKPKPSATAYRVASRALIYGTGLCLVGSALISVGVGLSLGVKNVSAATVCKADRLCAAPLTVLLACDRSCKSSQTKCASYSLSSVQLWRRCSSPPYVALLADC